jgi:hypothetical protein
MSRNDSWHRKFSIGQHFQNGRHNTAQIQHCSPQTTGLKNKLKATFEIEQCWIFAVLWWPFWKWRPVEIFQCRESIQDVEIEQCWICAVLWRPFWKCWPIENFRCQESFRDIIIYPHMKCHWNWTGLHFQNGHHNTAKIQHCSISKVAFNLFFKPVVCGRFGRLHNR